jgi:hypothetical protein
LAAADASPIAPAATVKTAVRKTLLLPVIIFMFNHLLSILLAR